MNNIDTLLKSIANIKSKYDIERDKDSFNIVNALHDMYDERRLHSRLISYLLSPSSGHKMGVRYLELFLHHVLKREDFSTTNVAVLPNEAKKSEYENIDILIINNNDQAIIIENKIRASNSNNDIYRDGYKGQLERYYTTIKTGENHQHGKTLKRNEVWVYYLSPEGRAPTDGDVKGDALGKLHKLKESWNESHILSYDEHIRTWLEICISITPNDKVKMLIDHYLKLINKMTNNDLSKDERLELKAEVGNDTENIKYLLDNFKHVKWHTVDDFWVCLNEQLKENCYQNVKYYVGDFEYEDTKPDFNKAVTGVTHYNKIINYGIKFDSKKGERFYISGENDLSWGKVHPKSWERFYGEDASNINFTIFKSQETYQLINKEKMKVVVGNIIDRIIDVEKNNFKILKP